MKSVLTIDIHMAFALIIGYFFDTKVARTFKRDSGFNELLGFQQVEINEFFSLFGKFLKEFVIPCKRYTGKIRPQEFIILLPIAFRI
jgi:hypothetical protein